MYRADVTSSDGSDCPFASALSQLRAERSAATTWYPRESDQPADQQQSATSAPSKGTFLDETIVLRGGAGASFVAAVMDEFAAHRKLRRKRQASEVQNEQLLLCCILANGLRCHWYRATPLVSYQRKADAGYYAEPNRPKWLSAKALSRALELLEHCGLAVRQIGERGTSSGYRITYELLKLAGGFGVSGRSLGRSLHRDDLVRLKGPKPKPWFDTFTGKLVRSPADRIYFVATSLTEKWRDGLTAFNNFLSAQDVSADPPREIVRKWTEKSNGDELHTGAKIRQPEMCHDALYRVFNDGCSEEPRFEKGGRLVGGWWINAPEEVRPYIKINGELTVELDYGACHPRMLYHEQGLEPPLDPYEIPEVTELEQRDGCAAGTYRPVVKWLTQVLINGRGRPDQVPVPSDTIAPAGVALRDISTFIRRKHKPISSSFGSRAGLRLMKTESEIAYAVITKAMESGWVALPIHDSFVAQKRRWEELKKLMVEEYKDRLNHQPAINLKSLQQTGTIDLPYKGTANQMSFDHGSLARALS